MHYLVHSLPARLLNNDPEALGVVLRWISSALASARFWSLRGEWPDLVQEVLARLVESLRLERYDDSRDFRVYVQGIARFVGLQALERRAAEMRSSRSSRASEDTPDFEAGVIDRQLARRIIDLASEDCRDLFRLYFFEARTYEEISRAMGIPIGTVKSRLFRCLECSQQALAPKKLRSLNRVRP